MIGTGADRVRVPAGAVCALLALCAPAAAQAVEARRFAVIAGNNDGGPGTRPLNYAHDDARRIHGVLLRVGQLRDGDAQLLLEQSADALRDAIDRIEPRVRQAAASGERPVLVVYFSGHAKDGALRLGRTALPLDELKQRMARSAAEVRIGLLDSCRSGAITRTKGARRAPAFEVDAGALQKTSGLVLLTSSSADEDSQESDELGGSFFSHHLASGMLGAADASGDGRVSLGEAYAYAYERTVADTADTAAGAQHPTFAYDLAGKGDVILTDLLVRREGVLIAAVEPAGSWFLVDQKGAVAAEIAKAEGVERRVALSPGTYRVKRRLPDRLRIGEIRVASAETAQLSDAALRDAPFSDDPVKGVYRRWEPPTRWSMSLGAGYQSFFSGPFPATPLVALDLQLRDYLRADWLLAFDLALGGGDASLSLGEGALAYRFTELGLGVSIIKEWPLGPVAPFAGGRLAMISIGRTFEDARVPKQGYFAMTPGVVGGARLQLSESWAGLARIRVHYLYYNVDSQQSLGYLEGALALSYEF